MKRSTSTQQPTIPWSSLLRQRPRQCSTLQLTQQGWGNYQELSCSLSGSPWRRWVRARQNPHKRISVEVGGLDYRVSPRFTSNAEPFQVENRSLRKGRFTAALPAADGTIYRSGGDDLPQRGGRVTAALPAAEETIHRSASNELRRSASATSFPAGTLTHPP